MEAASAFRQALLDGSVSDTRALWGIVYPHMPQPQNDQEAAVMMHHARTQGNSFPLRDRAYSHRWLTERALPSGLPDHLRARAERIYPVITDAVGIAVRPSLEKGVEHAVALRGALSDAVADCYANGDKNPEVVKTRMAEVFRKWRRRG